VSWPLHLLLLGVSLLVPLIALLTLYQPAAPLPPSSPLQFSGAAAANLTGRLATAERESGGACCNAGSQAELGAADWVAQSLHDFDPSPHRILFATNLPWQSQPVPMTDVIAYRPGRTRGIIAVIVHRDGGTAADLAGTAILVELGKVLNAIPRDRGVALISTDGGLTGGQGAAAVATRWPLADRIVAAIVVDAAVARGDAPLHIVTRPSTPRGVSPTLYAAARNAVAQWYGTPARIPGAYDQLSGYGVPYAPGEQGPLLGHGISALTLTVGRGAALTGSLSRIDPGQLGRVGATVANLVAELNSAPTIEQAGSPVLLLDGKVMRGWLAEASMAVLLAPFVACVLDLVARLRRRRIAIAPGLAAFAWRSAAWLITLAALWVLAATAALRHLDRADPRPHRRDDPRDRRRRRRGPAVLAVRQPAATRAARPRHERGAHGGPRGRADRSGPRRARAHRGEPVRTDRRPARRAHLAVAARGRASGPARAPARVPRRDDRSAGPALGAVVVAGPRIGCAADAGGDDRQRLPGPRRVDLLRPRRGRGRPARRPRGGALREPARPDRRRRAARGAITRGWLQEQQPRRARRRVWAGGVSPSAGSAPSWLSSGS
jgi:hypothetical protein